MNKITDEELAKELFEIVRRQTTGIRPWNESVFRLPLEAAARRARELLKSDWPDPIPIVTGEEVTYPCIAFSKTSRGWAHLSLPKPADTLFHYYSHFIPMPPAPVVDPFEEWWKDVEGPDKIDTDKSTARYIWLAALKSKEAK